MSELSFEEMLNDSLKTIRTGEIVTGKVIDVKPDYLTLNIGYKSDGIIHKADWSSDSSVVLTEAVKPGDEVEAKVKKLNDGEGLVVLSHKEIIDDKINEKVQAAFEAKEAVVGKVEKAVTGGLAVLYEGGRVFIPASLVSDVFERDLTKYEGQDIEFVITECNPAKRRVIGDRKQLVAAAKAEAKEKLLESINAGDVVEGTVKNITEFGAFVDLGGADGLLHVTEMGWGRQESPKKAFKSGDTVRVMIKEIKDNKIALTRKFPDENPWVLALEKYAPGNVVTGKVARLTDFGAFVTLETGIDALLHVSQISNERIEKPADKLKIGDEITAKITDLDAERRRVSLSIKALTAPPKKERPAKKEKKEEADVVDAYTDTIEESSEE